MLANHQATFNSTADLVTARLLFSASHWLSVILPAISYIPFFAEEIIRTKPRFIVKLLVLVTLNFIL